MKVVSVTQESGELVADDEETIELLGRALAAEAAARGYRQRAERLERRLGRVGALLAEKPSHGILGVARAREALR